MVLGTLKYVKRIDLMLSYNFINLVKYCWWEKNSLKKREFKRLPQDRYLKVFMDEYMYVWFSCMKHNRCFKIHLKSYPVINIQQNTIMKFKFKIFGTTSERSSLFQRVSVLALPSKPPRKLTPFINPSLSLILNFLLSTGSFQTAFR